MEYLLSPLQKVSAGAGRERRHEGKLENAMKYVACCVHAIRAEAGFGTQPEVKPNEILSRMARHCASCRSRRTVNCSHGFRRPAFTR